MGPPVRVPARPYRHGTAQGRRDGLQGALKKEVRALV